MTESERKVKQREHSKRFRELHPDYHKVYQANRRKAIADGTWATRNRVTKAEEGSSIQAVPQHPAIAENDQA